ncbi:alpha/beta-hydrolase [Metschnikowia bicuspidata var. bicuspidata NRRL YB-4993]|uniref:Alpha/beta-hydrolase n=1 Tax=Metschnikowia bicuspidata var. bicuspidata NRRL YB-4993 TaxID=869754 RepID=A0A1A0HA11_9ASCO|nr:alpha/beta-hydrolase [Metschnikowia bicuspidata var. bicuspidata NRRL YB-4993]OBA20840.1 alpha/beta-hydrolase [Metschnikowia bicuspidata var. bicuspidata NRRL YB-4993]
MSLRSICVLLKLPLDLLIVVLRFYIFGGLRFRKYSRQLINCLRLRVYRAALTVDIPDGKLIGPHTNSFLIRKVIPFILSTLVKNCSAYGERFDAQSFWLVKQKNRKPSDPVIIFCHGGGYYIQTVPSQIQSVISVYQLLDPEVQRRTSILFLDYKLVSDGYPFPTQLHQLDDTYNKLIQEGNHNITLMGDSAGGHLAIAYTIFLRSLEKLVVYPSKLVLISPWVKLSPLPSDAQEGTSWHDNEDRDLITYHRFSTVSDLKHMIGFEDPFSLLYSPGGKTPRTRDDWSSIPNYSDPNHDVFLILGEDESFRDDIVQWASYALNYPQGEEYGAFSRYKDEAKFTFTRHGQPGNANLTAYVEPMGVHDAMLYFEHDIAKKIEKVLRMKKKPNVKDFDLNQFFGVTRLTKFLNETL